MKSARKMIFKNLILALALVIIALLLCIAWFSSKNEASASGLTVKSGSPSGLESSLTGFNGDDWSTEHTQDINLAFPLITGNGEADKFFLPALDLSSGSPTYTGDDSNSNWISKREVHSTKEQSESVNADYIEQDIYFRSEQPLSVYLRSDSTVTSPNIEAFNLGQAFGNKSLFGNFPTDFIAAAARVSFSTVTGAVDNEQEQLQYVWAPNDAYQLVGDSSFSELEPQSSGVGTGFNPPSTEGWGIEGNSDHYMWVGFRANSNFSTPNNDNTDVKDYVQNQIYYHDGIQMQEVVEIINNEPINVYYAVVDAPINSIGNSQLYFYVNQSNQRPSSGYTSNIVQQDEYVRYDFTVNGSSYYIRGRFTGNVNNDVRAWAELNLDTSNPNYFQNIETRDYDRYQLKIAYWEDSNGIHLELANFVFYDYSNPDNVDGPGVGEAGGAQSINYYLQDGQNIIISATDSTTALTPNATRFCATYALSGDRITAYEPNSVFVVEKTDDASSGENLTGFYLKHLATDEYLCVSSDANEAFYLSDSVKTAFSIAATDNGISIQSSDSGYIAYSDSGGFDISSAAYGLKIFVGSSYSVITDSTAQQSYQYYNTSTNTLETLTTVKLTNELGTAPIVTLTKQNETDQYYTAHIRVRIWAEGTDREAKTPLEGGTFNTQLVFEGILSQADTTGS